MVYVRPKKKKDKEPKQYRGGRFKRARQTATSTHASKTQMFNKATQEEIKSMNKVANDPQFSARDRIDARRRAARAPTLLARQLEKADNDFARATAKIDGQERTFGRSIGKNMGRLETKYRLRGYGSTSAIEMAKDEMVRRMGADVEGYIPEPTGSRADGYQLRSYLDKDRLTQVRRAASKRAQNRGENYVEQTFDEPERKKRQGERDRAQRAAGGKQDPRKMNKEDALVLNNDRKTQIADIKEKWRLEHENEDDEVRRGDLNSKYARQINRIEKQKAHKEGDELSRWNESDLTNKGLLSQHRAREMKNDRIADLLGHKADMGKDSLGLGTGLDSGRRDSYEIVDMSPDSQPQQAGTAPPPPVQEGQGPRPVMGDPRVFGTDGGHKNRNITPGAEGGRRQEDDANANKYGQPSQPGMVYDPGHGAWFNPDAGSDEGINKAYMDRLAGAQQAIRGMTARQEQKDANRAVDLEEYEANWPGAQRMRQREQNQRREQHRQHQYDTTQYEQQHATSDAGRGEQADQYGVDREIARADEEDYMNWQTQQADDEYGNEMADKTRVLIDKLISDSDPMRWSRPNPEASAFDEWLKY